MSLFKRGPSLSRLLAEALERVQPATDDSEGEPLILTSGIEVTAITDQGHAVIGQLVRVWETAGDEKAGTFRALFKTEGEAP